MIIKKDENFWGGTDTRVFLPLPLSDFPCSFLFLYILFNYTRETDGLHLLANSSSFLFGEIRTSLENLTANWRFGLKYFCLKWLRLLKWLLYWGPQQKLLYKTTELEHQRDLTTEDPSEYMLLNSTPCSWFQDSTAKEKRTALIWPITQRVVVIPYRRFGTTYWFHVQGSRINSWPLKMGREGCPETSVRNYHYRLRNRPN